MEIPVIININMCYGTNYYDYTLIALFCIQTNILNINEWFHLKPSSENHLLYLQLLEWQKS